MKSNAQNYYEFDYEKMMQTGLTGKIFPFSNRMIEKKFKPDQHFQSILELGATGVYHLPHVKCSYDEYHLTDINPIQKTNAALNNPQVIIRLLDATNVSKENSNSYDRIIATCLVLHLAHLESVLSEWRRLVKPNGFISIYVHSEPGLLLRFLRSIIQVPKSRRQKDRDGDFLDLIYSEHVSHYLHVKHVIKKVFKNDEVEQRFFPFPFLSWNFNFWKIYTIQIFKVE